MENYKIRIIKRLYDNIYPLLKNDRKSIFLIGSAAKSKKSLRYNLRKQLESGAYFRNRYDIYYPEEVFVDSLYNSKVDLLTLENLLAESVNVVLICLESSGAITELGAFTNHKELRKKLLVIVDKKYKRAKSFIRKGPLKLLESLELPTRPIIWFDSKKGDIKKLSKSVQTIIGKVCRKTDVNRNLHNLIFVADFLLIILYILGPLSAQEIMNYIGVMDGKEGKKNITKIICSSALNTLFKQRAVFLKDKKYKLTRLGFEKVLKSLPTKKSESLSKIDSIRIDILNKSLRNWDRSKDVFA